MVLSISAEYSNEKDMHFGARQIEDSTRQLARCKELEECEVVVEDSPNNSNNDNNIRSSSISNRISNSSTCVK